MVEEGAVFWGGVGGCDFFWERSRAILSAFEMGRSLLKE